MSPRYKFVVQVVLMQNNGQGIGWVTTVDPNIFIQWYWLALLDSRYSHLILSQCVLPKCRNGRKKNIQPFAATIFKWRKVLRCRNRLSFHFPLPVYDPGPGDSKLAKSEWACMVWRPTRHIIGLGHFGDDFYRPDDQTNSDKALNETSWSSKIRLESHRNRSTMLQ